MSSPARIRRSLGAAGRLPSPPVTPLAARGQAAKQFGDGGDDQARQDGKAQRGGDVGQQLTHDSLRFAPVQEFQPTLNHSTYAEKIQGGLTKNFPKKISAK